jgi:hypothetical protein
MHIESVEEEQRLLAEEISIAEPKLRRALEKLFHGVSAGKMKCCPLLHW